MKLVYICSPFAGDIENNLRFAWAACRYVIDQGCAPLAVHLLYPESWMIPFPLKEKLEFGWACGCWHPVMSYGFVVSGSAKG